APRISRRWGRASASSRRIGRCARRSTTGSEGRGPAMADYTTSELMVSRAAKELKNGDVVFVGIGVPSLAVNLAYRTHGPGICMIYESGAVGCVPKRLPISIG